MNNVSMDCLRIYLGIILAALLTAHGSTLAAAEPISYDSRSYPKDPFPQPPQISAAVAFWQQVFGVWHRTQFALHDDQHLGVIYEVFDLPNYFDEEDSREQRQYADRRRGYLADELKTIESRVRYRLPLDARQQRLLNVVTTGGGPGAIYGAGERVRCQRGMRERFQDGITISGRYDAMIRRALHLEVVPEDLAYLPHVESSFQSNARSSVGAAGIWQFMPATARLFMRKNAAVDERFDPVLAARGAARYLADAYCQLGDWGLAITSYNHGVAGMLRARDEWGADIGRIVQHYRGPAFGFASRNFYAEFLAVRNILTHLPQYFPAGVAMELPWQRERVNLPQHMWLSDLSRFFRVSEGTLGSMNPALTSAALLERCPIPADTDIWLPQGTLANTEPLSAFRPAVLRRNEVLQEDTFEPERFLRRTTVGKHLGSRSHARHGRKSRQAHGATYAKHSPMRHGTRRATRKSAVRRPAAARGRLALR